MGVNPAAVNRMLYGRRNIMAEHVHNFLTRDGTPPAELRRLGREQLRPYEGVELREEGVTSVEPLASGFRVHLAAGDAVECRRVLLTTGLIDELPDLPGYRELWGRSIFQCPYCHGWEVRDQAFGVLATSPAMLDMALFLTGWSRDVIAFTGGPLPVPAEQLQRLERGGIRLETRRLRRFLSHGGHLETVELEDGTRVAREVLFARPPQRQTEVVRRLGLALDEHGFVRVNAPHLETSLPGVHAAGDLTTQLQGAIFAASAGFQAAAMINHALNLENAEAGFPSGVELPPAAHGITRHGAPEHG